MNRRHFLAGSMALAGQQRIFRSMEPFAIPRQDSRQAGSPQNLLSTTYPLSFLESALIPLGEWHPYPRWSERGPWETVPADIRTVIVERAQAEQIAGWKALLATTFLDFTRNGNRTRYETDSFGRRSHLEHVVLAECLEGQGRFLDDIANGVWLICEETFWGIPADLDMQRAGSGLPDVTEPIIELFCAVTGQVLAWTKYLLGDQLDKISAMISRRIQIEVERRILQPARDRDDFWWMGLSKTDGLINNWNPWINSNLLVTNLLLEDDPKLRAHEVAKITRSLDVYLNKYWPDAAEEEGPQYFNFSVLCYFEAVKMIESATGNSTSIFANPFIDAMGRYIIDVHIAGDDYFDYGDSHVHAGPDGDLLYRFGKAVHDEQLEAFGAYCAAKVGWNAAGNGLTKALDVNFTGLSRSIPAMLDADGIRAARQDSALVRDAWYPEFGLMTARAMAGSTEGMYAAVLASNNGRSHGHNDTGSFVIYQDGEPVTIDVGVEAYTAKTFDSDRFTLWTMQSAYHNLPTIGGVMQHDGAKYKATERRYESNDEHATFSFNIAGAYPVDAGVKKWMRTVTLDRIRKRVTVKESFELASALPVSLSIMTPRVPSVDSTGNIILKLSDGEISHALLKFDGGELQPVVEKIPLSDEGLRMSWGSEIYRILLNSRQPVMSSDWSYEFFPAAQS